MQAAYYIGIDIGSSFLKVSLLRDNGIEVELQRVPSNQMKILGTQSQDAEQDAEQWWQLLCEATRKLVTKHAVKQVKGIGICYQMHGLICIDAQLRPLRNCIIWCDNRTQKVGQQLNKLFLDLQLTSKTLSLPSNLTLSKLKWVQIHQPEIYQKIYKIMLPGDYIAMKLTNEVSITQSGLSECVLWDFGSNSLSEEALKQAGISPSLIPKVVNNFSVQGYTTSQTSKETFIPEGTPVYYRGGDQPNNAWALQVREPGEIAATAGTSGVIYAITDKLTSKEHVKINSILHFNSTKEKPRVGKLMCISGCGSAYRWLRQQLFPHLSYPEMNTIASASTSSGIMVIPFGNGAERILQNCNIKSSIRNLDFNRHTFHHIIRAVIQSIAFSFLYGIEIMQSQGLVVNRIRTTDDNLFLCETFCEIIATVLQCTIEKVSMTGAMGAALNALAYDLNKNHLSKDHQEPTLAVVKMTAPNQAMREGCLEDYRKWKEELAVVMSRE